MKHNPYVYWFTFIGLSAVISLQCLWLYNTYKLMQDDIQEKCNQILDYALYTEINLASKHIPKGKEIIGGVQNDSIPSVTYLYNGLHELGIQHSIFEIDSIIKKELKRMKIHSDFVVLSINPKTKIIYEKSNSNDLNQLGIIKSDIIPTRLDYSHGIQLLINSPHIYFFGKMWSILVLTIILVIFSTSCIAYQIRTIIRLNKIFQIREDFSYAMVHDMKNPLSSIMSTLTMLKNGAIEKKPELKEKYINIVASEANHLLLLTNKILTISKLESDKLVMIKNRINLCNLLEKLIDKFQAESQKEIFFQLYLKQNMIYANDEYMEEVFRNLIDNAIKYSNDTVEIIISTEIDKNNAVIKIRDNGFGMTTDEMKVIFDKFERASAAKRIKKGGASGFGLGLNLVKRVITAHGGAIYVDSKKGEFSEFTIYLPQIIEEI